MNVGTLRREITRLNEDIRWLNERIPNTAGVQPHQLVDPIAIKTWVDPLESRRPEDLSQMKTAFEGRLGTLSAELDALSPAKRPDPGASPSEAQNNAQEMSARLRHLRGDISQVLMAYGDVVDSLQRR